MTWIQTLDNRKFDLLNPRAEDVDPDVICKVLARIPRFGGHTKAFYSVAQHSLLVESLCGPIGTDWRLAALLHDAHEVYSGFGDVCRPAKTLTGSLQVQIARVEALIDRCMGERFGFDYALFKSDQIRQADNVALATEARDLMGPPPEPWSVEERPSPVITVEPFDEQEAYRRFSARLYELWSAQ